MKSLILVLVFFMLAACSSVREEANPNIEYLLLKHLRIGMDKDEVTSIIQTHATNINSSSDECYRLKVCSLEVVTINIPIGEETFVCSGGILKLKLSFDDNELLNYEVDKFYMCL